MERNLYAYEYVNLAYDDIVSLLGRAPTAIMQSATDAASDHAHEVYATLHVQLGGFQLARSIRVEVGDLELVGPKRAKLPLSWSAAQHGGLFPSMKAELEIAELSAFMPSTQVSIVGSYVPPVGMVGAVGDTLPVLHRLAEASVHRFIHDICNRLRSEVLA